MKDLSLHILDVTGNSVKAGATLICISLIQDGDTLNMTIEDNGCGMSPEFLQSVLDPFTTTRVTRKVGLGLPLLKLTAEQTNGSIRVDSKEGEGTTVQVVLHPSHIDAPPLGDLASTMATLIQGSPNIDFVLRRAVNGKDYDLDTREMRAVLDGVALDTPDVYQWIQQSILESEEDLL
jgi:hypothetical protein